MAPDAAFEVWSLHGPRSGDVLACGARGGRRRGQRSTARGSAARSCSRPRSARRPWVPRSRGAVAAAGGVVGDAAGWEALRLERGVPRFGVDFDDKMYPQEAALEKAAVSFDKGCYLGQEVVCMLEMRGHVKRKLASVVVDDDGPTGDGLPARGAPVTDEAGATVGEVTSAAPRRPWASRSRWRCSSAPRPSPAAASSSEAAARKWSSVRREGKTRRVKHAPRRSLLVGFACAVARCARVDAGCVAQGPLRPARRRARAGQGRRRGEAEGAEAPHPGAPGRARRRRGGHAGPRREAERSVDREPQRPGAARRADRHERAAPR